MTRARRPFRFAAAALLWVPACAFSAQADDAATTRLRLEIAKLKARVAELERSCPAAPMGTSPVAESNAPPPPTINTPAPASVAIAASPAPATPPVEAPPSPQPPAGYRLEKVPEVATAAPVLPAPPPGYRLVKEPEKYSETGCTRGMFQSGGDAAWKHEDSWALVQKGAKSKEIEGALGPEHYNVVKGSSTIWQYGKCGSNVEGFVVLQNDAVVFWQKPDF